MNLDYNLLVKQQMMLARMTMFRKKYKITKKEAKRLEGILHLIDGIRDQIETQQALAPTPNCDCPVCTAKRKSMN